MGAVTKNERWRQVEGWPYEVSNKGRVRRSEDGQGTYVGRVLNPSGGDGDYESVTLCHNGRSVLKKVHHLVLEAFVRPRPEGYVTNHKNGVKDDNRVENLEWVTYEENTHHAFENGLANVARGEEQGFARLRGEDVRSIREVYAKGVATQSELAEEYGVDQRTISLAVRGETWAHIGGPITRRQRTGASDGK